LKSCKVAAAGGAPFTGAGVGVTVLHEMARNTKAQRREETIFVFIIQSVI